MYDDFKVANYSKALLSPELYARQLSRLYTGDVIDGLTVTPGTGLQVVLAPGNAMIRYGSSAVASARFISLVNNFNLTIGTADVSNPRLDLVVVYVDNAVSLPSGTPTSANLDGKGVAKAKIVPGTPNASPTAPNSTAIQASVGSGNPYAVVAQVRVNAGVSVIAGNMVTDLRSVAKLGATNIDFSTLYSVGGLMSAVPTLSTSWQTAATVTIPTLAAPITVKIDALFQININNSAAEVSAGIFVNGVQDKYSVFGFPVGFYFAPIPFHRPKLVVNSGDVITFRVVRTSGSGGYLSSTLSTYSITRVGA